MESIFRLKARTDLELSLSHQRAKSAKTRLALATLFLSLVVPHQPASASTCNPEGPVPANISRGTVSFGGGTGADANNAWQICSIAQLRAIETNTQTMGAFYVLRSDLDFANAGTWDPIGAANSQTFTGSLNGNFHTLRNLTIGGNRPKLGLFGATTTGSISKIKFQDVTIVGGSTLTSAQNSNTEPSAGVIAGSATSTISEILIDGVTISGNLYTAGFLVGTTVSGRPSIQLVKITGGSLTSSWAANSSSKNFLGGAIGRGSAHVFRASIEGTISRTASAYIEPAIGGVFGASLSSTPIAEQIYLDVTLDGANGAVMAIGGVNGENITTIKDVFFEGSIVNPSSSFSNGATPFYVGGLSGLNRHDTDTPIATSLVISSIPYSSRNHAGPIIGEPLTPQAGKTAPLTSFYSSTNNPTFAANAGSDFGTPKTNVELQDIATFDAAGWSIEPSGSTQVTNWSISGSTSSDGQTSPTWTNPIWQINPGASFPRLVWLSAWPASLSSPTNLNATSPSAGTASLSWTAPSGTIAGYRIESSTDNGSTWQIQTLNTGNNSTAATITGLTPGRAYSFRVSATSNSAFSSGFSTPSVNLLMGSNPGSPQNLAASRLTENSFRVSWDPPSNTGGLSITGYTLQVDKGNGFETVAHTGTSAEITGVSTNSLWSFRVLATNVVGSSSYAVYTNTPPVPYSGPIVTSFSTREVAADRTSSVTLDGLRLSQVTELFIGTTKLSFTRSPNDQLLVSLPALAKGVYDLRMVYSGGGVITHQAALTVVDAPVVLPSRTLLFTNFAGDGFRLPAAAARGIRSAVSSLGQASKIVCTGSTSGTRATASDRRLALRRAQEACDLAKRLVPGVVTEVRANPASGVGARFRNVTVTIFGN